MDIEQEKEKKFIRYKPSFLFDCAHQHFYQGPAWKLEKIEVGSTQLEPIVPDPGMG